MQQWRLAVAAIVASTVAVGSAGAEPAAPLLRVFLTNGSSLTSFGEWVRLENAVVFSLPLSDTQAPDLQLITLAAAKVDWPKTERYAQTVRAVHYASTRAEDDYVRFSSQVASVLTGVAKEPDPKRRLAMAESARSALADWPRHHHGYRATDMQQMLALLDEVVAELRAAAGLSTFEVSLVAATAPEANEVILPAPSTAQLAEELLAASALADSVADRMTLLERLIALIDRTAGLLSDAWAVRVRAAAVSTLTTERATDAAYAKLATLTLERASKHSRSADVRALDRLRAETLQADAKLGRKRPSELAAMLGAIDSGADAARRLRLAGDQWRMLAPVYRSYERAVRPVLAVLAEAAPSLEDIRSQAGPRPEVLKKLQTRFYEARPSVVGTNPPPPLAAAHALLTSAWDLANGAVVSRMRAIETGSEARAVEASAAAAGALMLAVRARDDIALAVKAPTVP